MGIISEKLETKEDVLLDEKIEDIQAGKYYMGTHSLHWSLDLSSNTITLNLVNRPDLGTKVISRERSEAEFRVDQPWYKQLNAKISGNFDSKQLILNGSVTLLTGSPHPSERSRIKKYENVIIASW
jgi:hypothetical protein